MIAFVVMLATVTALLKAPPPPVISSSGPPHFDPSNLSDKEYCALMSGAADRARAKMPMEVAPATQATSIVINCQNRTYQFGHHVSAARAQVKAGWPALQQAEFNQKVCSGPLTGPMARRRWRFTDIYTFDVGDPLTFVGKCDR
jgi:hypothetical protein